MSELLNRKLIEEPFSPFSSPANLKYKKMKIKTIDFKDLNKFVTLHPEPFSLIGDLVEKTRHCDFFAGRNVNSHFLLIPLGILDKQKIVF